MNNESRTTGYEWTPTASRGDSTYEALDMAGNQLAVILKFTPHDWVVRIQIGSRHARIGGIPTLNEAKRLAAEIRDAMESVILD